MLFTVALTTIATMLLYAVPGYIMIRKKMVGTDTIPAFAKLLLFICQPFQSIYAMQQIRYSVDLLGNMGIVLLAGVVLMGGMLAAVYFLLHRKQEDVRYRICTIASTFGNCGFIGIPLLEALMPHYPEALILAPMFYTSSSIMMWTVASAIITRDTRYIKIKKVFWNPSTVSVVIGLILFFGNIQIAKLSPQLDEIVTMMGKMSTPLCMIILGMRLAAVPLKPMFTSGIQYVAIGLKLIAFPLITLALCSLFPLDRNLVQTIYILACVPVGNAVLSFSEILGEGQETAANIVLLSTILSAVTIPVMMLLL